MARASTPTWLSLDRFAQLLGIMPLHFNQLTATIKPATATCAGAWMQHPWQDADKVSREDVARAIQRAERMISRQLGYNLLPDWTVDEVQRTARPARPEVFPALNVNVRGQLKSVALDRGHFISGGQRATTTIQAGAAVVRSDVDGDGWDERMTAVVATTVTEPCEVRAYFPGHVGDPAWEIRPITVTIAAGLATIVFNSWQLVDPAHFEDLDAAVVNGDAIANFLTTIDVARVYNDPQAMAELVWEREPGGCGCGSSTCPICSWATQTGCLSGRDYRLGLVTYAPASWDADAAAFSEQALAVARDPDRVRAWYLSGFRDQSLACWSTTMDPELEHAVTYLAASLLDRPVCTCKNVSAYVGDLQIDVARSDSGGASYQVTPAQLECPFGTRKGALMAWGICQQEGRRVAR